MLVAEDLRGSAYTAASWLVGWCASLTLAWSIIGYESRS
jgi:hypothetical protein